MSVFRNCVAHDQISCRYTDGVFFENMSVNQVLKLDSFGRILSIDNPDAFIVFVLPNVHPVTETVLVSERTLLPVVC